MDDSTDLVLRYIGHTKIEKGLLSEPLQSTLCLQPHLKSSYLLYEKTNPMPSLEMKGVSSFLLPSLTLC